MAHAYLLPMKTAAFLFPLLAILLFVPTAIVLYRRYGVLSRWRGLSLSGFLYYLITAYCLVIVPLPSPSVDVCTKYAAFGKPELIPGHTFSDVWKEARHTISLNALLVHNPAVLEVGFNLLLLLPLGMYLRYHFRRGGWSSAAIGLAVASFFELTQLTGDWGLYPCPYRLFDVDDIIVNTLSCVLGWVAAGPIARRLPTLDGVDARQLARRPVPFGRRAIALLLDIVGCGICLAVTEYAYTFLGGGDLRGLFVVALVPMLGWFVITPWRTGATPGKHLLRLRLIDKDGGTPSPWLLLLREAVLAIAVVPPALVALVCGLFMTMHPTTLVLLAHQPPTLRVGLVYVIEQAPVEVALVTLVVLACAVPPIGFLTFARFEEDRLCPHEVAAGVRNIALPPLVTSAERRVDQERPNPPASSPTRQASVPPTAEIQV